MARTPQAHASGPMTFSDEADAGLREAGMTAEPERVVADERRRSPRVSVQRPMTLDFGAGPVDALLADVNVSGVGVHLPHQHPEPTVEAEFAAELPLRGGAISVIGRVVWADTRPGRGPSFGAELVSLSPEAAQALRDHVEAARFSSPREGPAESAWVAKLNGRQPPQR